jgi:hypothetical protein
MLTITSASRWLFLRVPALAPFYGLELAFLLFHGSLLQSALFPLILARPQTLLPTDLHNPLFQNQIYYTMSHPAYLPPLSPSQLPRR